MAPFRSAEIAAHPSAHAFAEDTCAFLRDRGVPLPGGRSLHRAGGEWILIGGETSQTISRRLATVLIGFACGPDVPPDVAIVFGEVAVTHAEHNLEQQSSGRAAALN